MSRTGERCWVEIDLGAIRKNVRSLRKAAGSAALMAVIKADAYGHGVLPVASLLQEMGVDFFCVATVTEGRQLREAGFQNEKILLLGSFFPDDLDQILSLNLIPTVADFTHLDDLTNYARRNNISIDCHLKVDTGMSRFGFAVNDVVKKHERIFCRSRLTISGLYSHLANSPLPDDGFTEQQIEEFRKLADFLELNNIWFGTKHLHNSGGLLNYRSNLFDGVRPGLSLYGYYPGPRSRTAPGLYPAMSFKTRVIGVRQVEAGATIGYARTFRAQGPMTIALLPVGYGDGYPTAAGNKGQVAIGKQLCPVVGRVCMDVTMVDVTGLKVRTGDTVLLWGGNGDLSVEKTAARIGSIPYVLTTCIGKRVPKIHVQR